MDRPYVVCHILSALDGKISGDYAGMAVTRLASEEQLNPESSMQILYAVGSVFFAGISHG